MATVLDIIKGLNQAAANAYDGALTEDEESLDIGLKREEGHPILDSRVIDGFKVRFSGNKMMVSYQGEMSLTELHPRNKFENEIERRFQDISKFLKKEYKKITKESVTLKEEADADIMVQSTSRIRSWVQATKQYSIGGMDGVEPLRKTSERSIDKPYEKKFREFLELSTTKKAKNDKAPKNPDTPEA